MRLLFSSIFTISSMEHFFNKTTYQVIISLLASIAFHILIIFFIYFFSNSHLGDNSNSLNSSTKLMKNNIVISTIKKNELKRLLRTVGTKNGRKDIFSAPIKKSIKHSKSSLTLSKETIPLQKKHLNLSKLGLHDNDLSTIKSMKESDKEDAINLQHSSYTKITPHPSFQKYISGKLEKNSQLAASHPNLFKTSDFQIKIETPLGVDQSKLNSTELIFYSFHKRVFEAYLSSIFKAYEEFKMANPHLDLGLMGKQILRAKIKYDDHGNIKEIVNINEANNQSISKFFHSILEENKIPNPPKEILNQEGGFNLEFQLLLNI